MTARTALLLLLLAASPSEAFFWRKKADPAHEKLMKAAVARLDDGDCAGAVDSINSLLAMDPSREIKERAYYCLGKCHEALGAPDRAINTYRLAAALYPDNPLFPKALAELYLANGFYDKAADIYGPLAGKDPSSQQLNVGLARSYAGLGAFREAAASYAAARAAGAAGGAFLAEYARCLESMRDFKGAAALLREARAAAPSDAGLAREMARLASKSGDHYAAAVLADEACGPDCRDGEILFEKGIYLLLAGERSGALAALDAAAALLPGGDQALALVRGLALRGLGRPAESAAALEAASAGDSPFLAGLASAARGKK
ncbi:MAG: tetratricopeptide repeat protein [Elusimicrobiales bacterium]|nr:tetratricopeptide repeat protein [Elusimicrobiales bacterium]